MHACIGMNPLLYSCSLCVLLFVALADQSVILAAASLKIGQHAVADYYCGVWHSIARYTFEFTAHF